MRKAEVFFQQVLAGYLIEQDYERHYSFTYALGYEGPPISLTMPVDKVEYEFDTFPPFFDGLLPEGYLLGALIKQHKLDRNDRFGQLVQTGADTVGAVTIKEVP